MPMVSPEPPLPAHFCPYIFPISSQVRRCVLTDKSRSEEDGKEDSPPRKIAGLHKMGIGGNILAEMKKIQEKRTSFLPKVSRIILWWTSQLCK